MGLIPDSVTKHYTPDPPELATKRYRTQPGMANWSEVGSVATCRECKLWTGCGRDGGYSPKGGIKPRACAKYRALMNSIGPAVPPNSRACRYFEREPNPPPAILPR